MKISETIAEEILSLQIWK